MLRYFLHLRTLGDDLPWIPKIQPEKVYKPDMDYGPWEKMSWIDAAHAVGMTAQALRSLFRRRMIDELGTKHAKRAVSSGFHTVIGMYLLRIKRIGNILHIWLLESPVPLKHYDGQQPNIESQVRVYRDLLPKWTVQDLYQAVIRNIIEEEGLGAE